MNRLKRKYVSPVLNLHDDILSIRDYLLHSKMKIHSSFCVIGGVFHVQYNGDPLVRLSPCSGVIAAGAPQWLRVELRTDRPKRINEKAL